MASRTEPHKLHLAAMRHSVADARLAAGEIDTREWLAAVRHTPERTRDATRELLREIRREVRRG